MLKLVELFVRYPIAEDTPGKCQIVTEDMNRQTDEDENNIDRLSCRISPTSKHVVIPIRLIQQSTSPIHHSSHTVKRVKSLLN